MSLDVSVGRGGRNYEELGPKKIGVQYRRAVAMAAELSMQTVTEGDARAALAAAGILRSAPNGMVRAVMDAAQFRHEPGRDQIGPLQPSGEFYALDPVPVQLSGEMAAINAINEE